MLHIPRWLYGVLVGILAGVTLAFAGVYAFLHLTGRPVPDELGRQTGAVLSGLLLLVTGTRTVPQGNPPQGSPPPTVTPPADVPPDEEE